MFDHIDREISNLHTPSPADKCACHEDHLTQQRYRHLVDHCPDAICVHHNGLIMYMNPIGVTWMGGTSQEQFIGRKITDFLHPDSKPAMLDRIASLRQIGDASHPTEVIMLRLDNTPIYMESISVRTVWERGEPAYQVFLRDLSAQKAAEEAQRYQQLIDHCPDMITVHQSGRNVYINPAGIKWMGGTSQEQFIGREITDFVHPDSISPMFGRIASLGQPGDVSDPAEITLLRLDGTPIYVDTVSVRTMWEGKPAYQVVHRDLSAKKTAEEALRYQGALVDHVSDAVIATTFDGIVTSWNPAAERIYRRYREDALAMRISEAVGTALDPITIAVDGPVETTHYTSDGVALAVRVSAAAMNKGYVLLISDYTARRRAEQYFQTVVEMMEEGVMVVSSDGHITSMNPAGQRILGISDLDRLNEHFPCTADTSAIDCQQGVLCTMIQSREQHTGCVFSFDRFSDGKQRWLSANSRLLTPGDADESAVLISFRDITTQHQQSQRLAHAAAHDELTGLPNRAELKFCINEHLNSPGRNALSAVLFMDLNGFKTINDTKGHKAGDQALKTAAIQLKSTVRSSDVVGRLGGDEFVIVVLGTITRTELDELAERIHTTLAQPTRIGDELMSLGTSIGITTIDDDDPRDGDQILADADAAMYAAKRAGGGATRYFTNNLLINGETVNDATIQQSLSP